MNLEQFHKLAQINREAGWEAAKAAFPGIPDAILEAHRAGVERARVLRPLPISWRPQRDHGPFEVESAWVAAMAGGAEWTAMRAALAAAGQLR